MQLDKKARRGLIWVVLWATLFLVFLIGGVARGNVMWSLIVLVVFLYVVLRWWFEFRHRTVLLVTGLDQIDTMSGIEFERYVAALLRGLGDADIEYTKATGDFGVDLIATNGTVRIAVQCKRQGRPVGTSAIQQVVAGAAVYQCAATLVVTNRLFTPGAQKLAEVHGVELVDRVRLEQLAISVRPGAGQRRR
jgi:restriction system protein